MVGLGHTRGMRWDGILPEDAPDPRLEQATKLKTFPVPLMGLISQPALEEISQMSLNDAYDDRGYSEICATLSYTLWRNPNDRADPINLAQLPEETRAMIDDVPPWPRPAWLVEQAEMYRYPMLWEAVRTTWQRDPARESTLSTLLVEHANYVLMNQYNQDSSSLSWDRSAPTHLVSERAINTNARVQINGVETLAAELDTDIYVYGIGAQLESGGFLTAVIPRSELKYINVSFGTHR